MKNLARLLFSFEGRIGRLQFWMACIVLALLMVVLGFVQALVELKLGLGSFNVVARTVVWLTVIPSIAIGVKRFNDLGWPKWVVYAIGISGVGIWLAAYVGMAPEGSAFRAFLFYGNVAVGCALFIACAFMKGRSPPAPANLGEVAG